MGARQRFREIREQRHRRISQLDLFVQRGTRWRFQLFGLHSNGGHWIVISIPVDLYGSTKSSTQLNVGASPELDLAIGTLCYVARPDVPCIVQGSNGVQYTWETRTVTYNGIQHVESSHPIF